MTRDDVPRAVPPGGVLIRQMRTLNLGILAHVDASKTTLTERLLYEAGVLGRAGQRRRQGAPHRLDGPREAPRHHHPGSGRLLRGPRNDGVNLVDTPGHSDFIAEVERSLSLLDGAVLVVSAVEGVQAQTLVLMRALQRGLATVVFVNKVDQAGADPEFVELEVRERLDAEVPVLFGSALTGQGVPAGCWTAFPPCFRPPELPAEGRPSGLVFKIDRDDSGGKECVAVLRAGTLHVRDRLDLGHDDPQRVTQLQVFRGGGLESVAEAVAGQVVALRGLEAARVGDGFGEGAAGLPEEFARPSLGAVVEPVHRARPASPVRCTRPARRAGSVDLLAGRRRPARAWSVAVRRGAAAGDRRAARGAVRRARAVPGHRDDLHRAAARNRVGGPAARSRLQSPTSPRSASGSSRHRSEPGWISVSRSSSARCPRRSSPLSRRRWRPHSCTATGTGRCPTRGSG